MLNFGPLARLTVCALALACKHVAAQGFGAPPLPLGGWNAYAVLPWPLGLDGVVSMCREPGAVPSQGKCRVIGALARNVGNIERVSVQQALEWHLREHLQAGARPILVGVGPTLLPTRIPAYSEDSFLAYYKVEGPTASK